MLFFLLVGYLLHGGVAQQICQWTSPMDDVDRSLFAGTHNTYRAYVARGQGYKLGGRLPGSTGLFELEYDCELELMAQMNTYGCNHTLNPTGTSMNYFMLVNEPHAWSKRELVPMAVSQWYQPVLKYRTDDNNSVSDIMKKSGMESFANMMYYKALKIGCSYSLCPATATTPAINAIACLYSPAPQKYERIYPADRYGCVDNADCWKYGTPISTCIKEGPYHGLCTQGPVKNTSLLATKMQDVSAQWKLPKLYIGEHAYGEVHYAQ